MRKHSPSPDDLLPFESPNKQPISRALDGKKKVYWSQAFYIFKKTGDLSQNRTFIHKKGAMHPSVPLSRGTKKKIFQTVHLGGLWTSNISKSSQDDLILHTHVESLIRQNNAVHDNDFLFYHHIFPCIVEHNPRIKMQRAQNIGQVICTLQKKVPRIVIPNFEL